MIGNLDIYYIEYYSAEILENKWKTQNDVFMRTSDPAPNKLVCFQIGESENSYVVCSMYNGLHCAGSIYIPKKCVTVRKRIFIKQCTAEVSSFDEILMEGVKK